MRGRKALVTLMVPHRFTSATCLYVSIVVNSTSPNVETPALFTTAHRPAQDMNKRFDFTFNKFQPPDHVPEKINHNLSPGLPGWLSQTQRPGRSAPHCTHSVVQPSAFLNEDFAELLHRLHPNETQHKKQRNWGRGRWYEIIRSYYFVGLASMVYVILKMFWRRSVAGILTQCKNVWSKTLVKYVSPFTVPTVALKQKPKCVTRCDLLLDFVILNDVNVFSAQLELPLKDNPQTL